MKRNKIVIVAGEFWAGASGRGPSDGLRDLGWAVQEVDQRDFGLRSGGSLALRLASRLTRSAARDAYQKSLLAECQTLRPDVFLTVKGVELSASLLRQIKETGTRTAMYYPDVAFDHAGVSIDSFYEYDLFVTTKTYQVEYLENLLGASRVVYVPHGYSSAVHRPAFSAVTESVFQTDVPHAGNHSAYKQAWIEGAAQALPMATFRLVGNRWREQASSKSLARCDLPGARTGVGYAEAIQTARINVAIHFGPTALGWQDRVSTRTFGIPACRGFMLHIDSDEVREFFEPGKEIAVFSTPEELVDKITFYLDKPALREQMVERAYQRCVPAYSYGARAKKIMDLLQF